MIIELVLEGVDGEEIARRYGVTGAAVTHRVRQATGLLPKDLRVERGWPNSRTSPKAAQAICDYYKPGRMTLLQISKHFSVSITTVQQCLAWGGIEFTPKKTWLDHEMEALIACHKAGASNVELAELLGVEEWLVRRHLNKVLGNGRGQGWAQRELMQPFELRNRPQSEQKPSESGHDGDMSSQGSPQVSTGPMWMLPSSPQ